MTQGNYPPVDDVMEDAFGEAAALTQGVLLMEGAMRGDVGTPFYPPHGHGKDIESQFRLVLNRGRLSSGWLNAMTDHLDDDAACEFVREGLQEVLDRLVMDTRQSAFGPIETKSAMKIVDVTCYPATEGGRAQGVENDGIATRRFVVYYNGF